MIQADIDEFNQSATNGPIDKVWADLRDLVGRLNYALVASDSIKVLRKKTTDTATQDMIDGHIKEIETLLPLAKKMRDEWEKFTQLKPQNYNDMPELLEKNIKFFHTANRFIDPATRLRQSMTSRGKLVYYGNLSNTHMKVIHQDIEEILRNYQGITISYRKHRVKLTGTG